MVDKNWLVFSYIFAFLSVYFLSIGASILPNIISVGQLPITNNYMSTMNATTYSIVNATSGIPTLGTLSILVLVITTIAIIFGYFSFFGASRM